MKQILPLILTILCAVAIGELDATMRHVGDYRRGWDAGYAFGLSQPRPEDAAVKGSLCAYAKAACQ